MLADPINLLIDAILSGLVSNCLFALSPTIVSPFLNATTEGVVLFPLGFSNTFGFPFSIIETTEFVVPRSIPKIISFVIISPF
ncbi:Uncharacterised protein [Chlamydia trachomatis]|nr:Uncharacterised protein [Chlamydia trachomatis]CRH47335.1 Uncharacterised protein [Chlamydia trachomatis]